MPNSVVEATNVNSFKARLGKLCLHQKVKFDFNAGLIETEDRPRQTESGMVWYIIDYTDADWFVISGAGNSTLELIVFKFSYLRN